MIGRTDTASFVDRQIAPEYRSALDDYIAVCTAPAITVPSGQLKVSLHSLPLLCCQALGGGEREGEIVNHAWTLLYSAFDLLDKVEDDELEGSINGPDQSAVITNLSTGLLLSAGAALVDLFSDESFPVSSAVTILQSFYQMALKVCGGQHLDLTVREPNLCQVWEIVGEKSGEFFALGCAAGAGAALSNPGKLEQMAAFGRFLGIRLQIANDIQGLWMKQKRQSDIAAGKCTLPVVYASTVLPPEEKKQLKELICRASDDLEAENTARSIIIKQGALVYLTLEAERYKRKAQMTLDELILPQEYHQALCSILTDIFPSPH